MAVQKEAPKTKVVTGKVRLSYAHLFEPYGDGDDKKFSTVLLIPKSDKATLRALREAQVAAIKAGLEKQKFGKLSAREQKAVNMLDGDKPNVTEALRQADWTNTLRDGDEEMDLEKNPEYAGHYFINVSSRTRPGIVDRHREPITDSTEVYSGCYARASINAFAFNTQGNKGVSFGLNHIQKVADGESFTGRSNPEDDFDDLEDDELDEDDDLI